MTQAMWYWADGEERQGAEEGATLERFSCSIARGDVCWLDVDTGERGHSFLKALATLIQPLEGRYSFKGARLDFSSAASILAIKKQIGYITSHSTLISNRSLRENLTLMRSYFDNNLSARVDDHTFKMCRRFSIADKIDQRPEDLDLIDIRSAVVVREFSKSLQLLLLEEWLLKMKIMK